MAKAEVELVGSLSQTVGGRAFTKGKTQVITNAAEIAAFKANPDYRVKVLKDATEKAAKPKPKPAAPPPAAEPEKTEEPAAEKPKYTKSKLGSMRKADLIEVGLMHDLAFTGDETAKQMVEDIMLAQEGD